MSPSSLMFFEVDMIYLHLHEDALSLETQTESDRQTDEMCSYFALVFLMVEFEFDVRVTQAVLIHRDEVTTLDETDADDSSPQLSLSVHL